MSTNPHIPATYVYPIIVALLAPLLAVIIVISSIAIGQAYEGRIWPVITDVRITSIEAVEGGSLVTFEFDKVRGCSYVGMEWYRGEQATGFSRARLDLRPQGLVPTGASRPQGVQSAGPWFIGLPPDEVHNNSFALIHYRCHPLYDTTTLFYP
jgi:hypothetical protein